MISLGINNGERVLLQTLTSPSVYLDHAALRKVSEDAPTAQRLVKTLHRLNGTLVISDANWREFCGVTITEQAIAAERFVMNAWPNLYFMDVNCPEVSSREITILPASANTDGSLPCEHQTVLTGLLSMVDFDTGIFNYQPGSLLLVTDDRREALKTQAQEDIRYGREFMQQYRNGNRKDYDEKRKSFRQRARKHGLKTQRATGIFMTCLFEVFKREIPEPRDNDFNDFIHACVPSSYCDFVILDKTWRHIVDKARADLAKDNIRLNIARVFSERNNGIKTFLNELERFPPSVPLPTVRLSTLVAEVKHKLNMI